MIAHTNHPCLISNCNPPLSAVPPNVGRLDRPTLRFVDLLKLLSVSRNKACEPLKSDPRFQQNIALYDSDPSPRLCWPHEAIAWIEIHANKFRGQREGN